MTKEDKDNDLWLYGVLGALGSAALYFLTQMGPPKFTSSNPPVNSYQSTASYTPPPPSKQGGCGCSAGR